MRYSNRYRRHLCDMHIDDWSDEFLSEFSPEAYVENLINARINNAMLYLQSHVGLCYFPTKVGMMHRAFEGREWLMRRTVELCHANDIKVTGYYSINYNTREHDRHPEWRMLTINGLSQRENGYSGSASPAAIAEARYGLCCPNSMDYRSFVYAQMDEMLDYFDLDALFIDMPFWPHTCYCANCRRRWAEEFGGEMPADPVPGTQAHDDLLTAKYRWMGEWATELSAYIKSKAPGMPVEFNYASAISSTSQNGCGDEVNRASDYVGGDLYGGMREHSFTCKFYRNATRSQPFEYMFCRCRPALRVHTLNKTADEMRTSVALTMAHHGATLVIDAIDPCGTMDARLYHKLGDMFAFQQPYEKYFTGDLVEDIGIYYGIRSRFVPGNGSHTSLQGCIGIANGLIAEHIPFGVTGAYHDIFRYRYLAAPGLSALEAEDNARLIRYVEEGGTLYISGGGNPGLVEALTGGHIDGATVHRCIYIAPVADDEGGYLGEFTRKYPLPFEGCAPIIKGVDPADVVATLTLPYTSPEEVRFASIHSNPPGVATEIPMIVVKKRGKGRVIWSAASIEAIEMPEYQQIVQKLLFGGCAGEFSLASDAPRNVELTLFRDDAGLSVNAVHLADDTISPAVPGFSVSVRCDTAPARVTLAPDGTPVPFEYADGYVRFSTRELRIFDMYRIHTK